MMGNLCRQGKREEQVAHSWITGGFWNLQNAENEYEFTQEEIHLLLMKWKLLTTGRSLRVFAYMLFEKLFVNFPDKSKLFFIYETGDFISSQQWKEHALFASHVREVMNSIGTIIQLLDNEEKLKEYLSSLAEFHRSLRGMKKQYIEVFVRIIDEAFATNFGPPYSGETQRVFRKVLAMMYYKMTWRLLV